ncbi:hypothetical protein NTGM5_560014 [Candidatus Nitrotoga sp. M5]|nr:hypothetical protein NTGM5_560014 [Candidatus Nitrotoga sp. M5]
MVINQHFVFTNKKILARKLLLTKHVLNNAVYALTYMRSNSYENGYCNHQAVQT